MDLDVCLISGVSVFDVRSPLVVHSGQHVLVDIPGDLAAPEASV